MHYNIKGLFWVSKILISNWFQLGHFQKCLRTFEMFGNMSCRGQLRGIHLAFNIKHCDNTKMLSQNQNAKLL